MALVHIGYSHKHTPFELLGRVSLPGDTVEPFLRLLTQEGPIKEVVGLCTCNRTEFTLLTEDVCAGSRYLLQCLADERHLETRELMQHAQVLQGGEVARHLFSVASGIDSLVVGEPEILGQVRNSLDKAKGVGAAGPILSSLYTRAIQAGRRARTETNISRGRVSIATVAADLIEERVANLTERTVLVIGTGEMGQLAAATLAERGVKSLMLTNRSGDKARNAAAAMGCMAIPMEELIETLRKADVVICATGAPHHIVTPEIAMGAGECLYLDLSAPPNVAPEVRRVPGATVLTIEDLTEIAGKNAERRSGEIESVENLLNDEVAKFEQWMKARPAEALVASLRRDVEYIRRAHLERHGRHFEPQSRQQLDIFTQSLLSAVLHRLTANLEAIVHDDGFEERLALARRLFAVDADAEPAGRG